MNLIIAFFLGFFVAILIWFIAEISEIEISEGRGIEDEIQ